MIVHKFGGTSLANADRLRPSAALVLEGGRDAVVVVSALAGVTDRLTALVQLHRMGDTERTNRELEQLLDRHLTQADALVADAAARGELEARLRERIGDLQEVLTSPTGATGVHDPLMLVRFTDEVVSAGEDLSAELMAAALTVLGVHSSVVDARTLIRTDARFGRAVPVEDVTIQQVTDHLLPRVAAGEVPVVQGFIGATANGVTTTLGRGGSDLTAAILGSAGSATEVCIWTDVNGIRSADPRSVPGARPIDEIGFEEAVELAYFGAKVVHQQAAKWAISRSVALRIRNSFEPDGPETRIRTDRRGAATVAAVAHKPGTVLIKVRAHPSSLPYGFLARVFGVLARHQLPVDLVATSHSSTAFTIDEDEEVAQVGEELGDFADVDVCQGLATVTVVGHGLMEAPGINARVFEAVGATPVYLISQASDVSLSLLVDQRDADEVVRRIHARLVADDGTGHAAAGPALERGTSSP